MSIVPASVIHSLSSDWVLGEREGSVGTCGDKEIPLKARCTFIELKTRLSYHGSSGRQSSLTFRHLQPNKNCYRSSFIPRTIPEWNSLPIALRSTTSIQLFESGLSRVDISKIINPSHYYD